MGTSKGYGLPTTGNWPDVKRQVTAWGKPGTSTPEQMSGIMGGYVKAGGGSQSIAQQSAKANRTGARFGGLVFGIRSGGGLGPALEDVGLGHLIGRPASEVMQGIRDYLVGEGDTLDDELVREAWDDFQEEIIGQHDTYEELDEALARLADQNTINENLARLFGYYVYKKFRRDFSERLLKVAGGVRQANRRLIEIKDFIFDWIRTKFHGSDFSRVDWQGRQGMQMAEEIHASVWRVFGEG